MYSCLVSTDDVPKCLTAVVPKGLAPTFSHSSMHCHIAQMVEHQEWNAGAFITPMMMTRKHSVVLRTDYAAHWDHMAEANTTDIVICNEYHFDPSGFLVNFLQTWRTWMAPFIKLPFQLKFLYLCPGFIKDNDTVHECILFIGVPFQMEVQPVPLLLFGKVVWNPT